MNDSSIDVSYQVNRQKIIFTGDIYVGKTSIINVLMGQKFNNDYEASIGVDFFSKTIKYKGKIIKLQIWDSAGQEKFRSLIPNYIRGSSLVFVVYDISNKKSFNNVNSWVNFVNNIENSNIVIVGNKIDLENKREVTYEEGKKYCEENNFDFFEVSAKNDINLNNMLFNSVASLPFFNSINADGSSKEQIVENLMKENLDTFKYQENKSSEVAGINSGLNVIGNDNNNKQNNTNGDISLKENKNVITNNEDNQVFTKKKKCC
jgi:Ras-related protein Rab-6A